MGKSDFIGKKKANAKKAHSKNTQSTDKQSKGITFDSIINNSIIIIFDQALSFRYMCTYVLII